MNAIDDTAATGSPSSTRQPGYAELLRQPGALAFVIPGAIGRLPLTMRSLGSALLIQELTGSYGRGGFVAAVITIVAAIASPRLGRIADARGVRGLMLWTLAGQVIGTVALVAAAYRDASLLALFLCGVVLGATSLSFGSITRAAWTRTVPRGPWLERAFAFEAVIEEAAFIVGPTAVIPLILNVNPAAGVVTSLVVTAIASLWLARLPASLTRLATPAADGAPDTGGGRQSVVGIPGLQVIMASYVLMGIVFGASELMLVAFAEEQGRATAAALLAAIFAAGSVIGGLVYGWVNWRMPVTRRLLVTSTWFGVALIPVILVDSIWAMAAAVLVTGLSISPTTIAGMTLTERITPPAAMTESFAWLGSAMSAGVAFGTLAGGRLIDLFDANGAQVLCVGCGLAAALVVLGGRRVLLAA